MKRPQLRRHLVGHGDADGIGVEYSDFGLAGRPSSCCAIAGSAASVVAAIKVSIREGL